MASVEAKTRHGRNNCVIGYTGCIAKFV